MGNIVSVRDIVPRPGPSVLGKIALDVERALVRRATSGAPGGTAPSSLARGPGWSVDDVICTFGPADRPFEEAHRFVSVAVVVAGTFQYRTAAGRHAMTPGALLLGRPGQSFECDHSHAAGDRCVAFRFDPDWFDRLAADAGVGRGARRFQVPRVPPHRATAPIVARASLGLAAPNHAAWEETALEVAARAAILAAGGRAPCGEAPYLPARALARTTDSVRRIERDPAAPWTLHQLAAEAGLSPFHYLRTFKQVAGVTPHQFVLRARLRAAALRLGAAAARVSDVAFASGFEDLSTFNHAFRAEFGVTPLAYRSSVGSHPAQPHS